MSTTSTRAPRHRADTPDTPNGPIARALIRAAGLTPRPSGRHLADPDAVMGMDDIDQVKPHAYEASWSGMVCGAMVLDDDGYGDQCGLDREDPVHALAEVRAELDTPLHVIPAHHRFNTEAVA